MVAASPCVPPVRKQTAEIITDVQALSHELHPPRLLLLGVVPAMRGLCRELSAQKSVEIDFRADKVPAGIPHDTSLCLSGFFRKRCTTRCGTARSLTSRCSCA